MQRETAQTLGRCSAKPLGCIVQEATSPEWTNRGAQDRESVHLHSLLRDKFIRWRVRDSKAASRRRDHVEGWEIKQRPHSHGSFSTVSQPNEQRPTTRWPVWPFLGGLALVQPAWGARSTSFRGQWSLGS